MHRDKVKPLRNLVLLEALFTEFFDEDELIAVPSEHRRRYPNLARIIRGAGLPEGSLAILRDEGEDVHRSYYDVFKLILNDDGKELELIVDNDVEPVLREFMLRYQKNPTSEDMQLTVEDAIKGEKWSFLCSDVLDWTYDQLATPGYELEYVPTRMIYLEHDGKMKLHYITPSSNIIALL